VLVIALGAARLAWSEGPVEVSLTEDRLSIRAHGAAAADVLAEVTKVTGVRFAIDPEARLGSVDVEIGPMDPERAIRSLVGSIPGVAGSAASYSKGANGRSQLVRLSLFGPGQAPGGSVAPPVRAPPFEDRPPAHGTDPEEENEGQPPAPPPPPAAPLPNVEGHRPRAPDDDARAASPRRLRAAGPRWERTVAV
jgi:hypothetical protein